MKTTIDFLDEIKTKHSLHSDWGIYKISGIKPQSICNYRAGRSYFDDSTAIKVANLLEIDPSIVVSAAHAERAKTEPEKAVWKGIYERLGGLAAAILLGIALLAPTPPASAATGGDCIQCILC